MKSLVLDTHALVWFLTKHPNISEKALKLILQENYRKIIPVIVLCEINYLHQRKRFALSVSNVMSLIEETNSFEVAAHEQEQIDYLLPELEIHDSLIVATACYYQKVLGYDVAIISKDEQIIKYSPVSIVW